jgi:hypothetical protein
MAHADMGKDSMTSCKLTCALNRIKLTNRYEKRKATAIELETYLPLLLP